MAKLTPEEKHFFEMANFKETKKISLNLGSETLNKIDDLAKILKITRTLALESILLIGLKSYIDTLQSANRKIKKDNPENKNLDIMNEDINKFKKKWNLL